MKNKLLIAALLIGSLVSANAQETTIYSQDFEADDEIIYDEGWGFYGFEGEPENIGIYDSSSSIQAAGFSGRTIGLATFNIVNDVPEHIDNMDFMAASPFIELPDCNSYVSYRAGSIAVSGAAGAHYSVYVLTTEDFMQLEDPESLKAMLEDRGAKDSGTISGGNSFVTSFSLNDYAGKDIILFFRLHDTTSNKILLFDDVTITAGTLGTNNAVADSFAIYPNPASGIVNINGANGSVINEVSLMDMNGRLLSNHKTAGSNTATVDVSSLNAGVYLVKVTSDAGTVTKRIVKS